METLEFDYVIVGGGAAGCVLAARLAAESHSWLCGMVLRRCITCFQTSGKEHAFE